ncbi:hypothetical protein F0562_000703 [Nyssa sinensis]|uniref:DUF7705 domain-containing protein n=1 Tax=Nyssa sinensis TaxID=561372 RepID=A0A5J5C1A4_9ASTE|nr:hypothetical protein F0562_000703 [Nyssa sinensis]
MDFGRCDTPVPASNCPTLIKPNSTQPNNQMSPKPFPSPGPPSPLFPRLASQRLFGRASRSPKSRVCPCCSEIAVSACDIFVSCPAKLARNVMPSVEIVGKESISAVGDPEMRRDGLRVAFEAWNFCNEVGKEAPGMGSPRAADCFDLSNDSQNHKVTEADNKLGVGKAFPGLSPKSLNNSDLYAVEKELYLGSLCEVADTPKPWHFWMVMLKNGNYDTKSGLCPENGKMVPPFNPGRFPCYGDGCMNQPLLYHQQTSISGNGTMRGGFNGTYELGSDISDGINGISYFEVLWEKKVGVGSWVFSHKLKTSKLYPWLMLYLRADATKGFSGGYHYDTRGMLKTLPESPNFKVRVTLDVKKGGGPKSQFYLIDMGSCWKNNGAPCDGDVLTDAQELVQLLPHPIWNEYGYPTKQGDGWVGDARTWELDVGGLSSRLYFYQDPGSPPARRIWTSLDMGTEIFVSDKDEVAEWTLMSSFPLHLTGGARVLPKPFIPSPERGIVNLSREHPKIISRLPYSPIGADLDKLRNHS